MTMRTEFTQNALDLLDSAKWLNRDRTRHNLHPDNEWTADYADEWGCDSDWLSVDASLEQRQESTIWKLAEELDVTFEDANEIACYWLIEQGEDL
jgi:hypothetical protein